MRNCVSIIFALARASIACHGGLLRIHSDCCSGTAITMLVPESASDGAAE